jgi:hypothetical protein
MVGYSIFVQTIIEGFFASWQPKIKSGAKYYTKG